MECPLTWAAMITGARRAVDRIGAARFHALHKSQPGECIMANLNKVMLIGRLTRDPEVRMFSNGGKVASFGFAVNNRRKNQQTGQWEDEPCFLDCEAFNK